MNSARMKTLRAKIFSMVLGAAACCILPTALRAAPQTHAAMPSQQKTFDTPQQAADAMILAVKNDDVAALLAIFGPAGKDFVSTGDDVQAKNSRAAFAAMAQEKMHVDIDPHNPKPRNPFDRRRGLAHSGSHRPASRKVAFRFAGRACRDP